MISVKLGDVAVEVKSSNKGDKSGCKIVGLEHLTPMEVTLSEWSDDTNNTFTKEFSKGDVLFGRRRAYLKKAAVAPFDGICSGDITVIRAIENKVAPDLLPFIIQNDFLFEYAVGKSAGSLSPRVKWEHLKKFEFYLPDMKEQKALAETLWSINETKQAYIHLIKQTDDLVKSQFVEMFGDNDFVMKSLSEECALITKGTTPTTLGYNFTDEGVNFVKIENISLDGHFIKDGMMYIGEDCNETMKRSQLKIGDVLFSIAGAIGRCVLVTEDILPANTNQALSIIRLKNNAKISKEFLMAALQSGYIENQYMLLKRGVAQLNLSLKDVGNFKIPIPSREQQEVYVDFARQTDKSKFALQDAINNLDALSKKIIAENLIAAGKE
ncbi:restriction endonuclease subunit S [Clostridium transplantifaecale]|uniref:restriction endonuclease subunit S n=1 Tax=Clostridium transplantifaecale TaxID=2479838 RepID=UPI000F6426BD|nr:restriction endonuclease subunit S [Clostridium transplantifaecale]